MKPDDAVKLFLAAMRERYGEDVLIRTDGSVVRAEKRVAFEGGDKSVLYALSLLHSPKGEEG